MESIGKPAVVMSVVLGAMCAAADVDFSVDDGVVRPLNGLCNMAPILSAQNEVVSERLAALKIPYYRHHDAPLSNPGFRMLDVSHVFPLFHADPDDPENYDFRASDDYLERAVRDGAEIEFRLGESIEHTPKHYAVDPPADFGKWAEICVHIVRHYNEGWANGHRWNIRRWTIWEEPNTNPTLLNVPRGEWQKTYFKLYEVTARRLKARFPYIEVGGPQTNHGGMDAVRAFVEYCASNSVPLDILSWSSYGRNPERQAALVAANRKLLDDCGFTKTKLSFCAWHWGPTAGAPAGKTKSAAAQAAWQADLTGMDSAAYTAAMLSRMQDTPIDYMYYYSAVGGTWGLLAGGAPLKPYWAFRAFAELAACPVRAKCDVNPAPGIYVLAGADRRACVGRILVSALRTDAEPQIALKGCRGVRSVSTLDAALCLEPTTAWRHKDGVLHLLRCHSDSAVWLVECDLPGRNREE